MATKIRPFSTQICHNTACTNAKAAEFTANRGFLGTAELMLPFKFFLGRPLLPWLQKLGYFRKKWAITRLIQTLQPPSLHQIVGFRRRQM